MTSDGVTGAVNIPTAHGNMSGYLSIPKSGGPEWPAVVVLHDIFGLRDDTRRIADDLASAGFLALAPSLYGSTRPLCLASIFGQMTSGRGRGYEGVLASRDLLIGRDDSTGKIGVVGFCMGGSYALVSAPEFDASAPYYGKLPKDWSVIQQEHPIVALYGSEDYIVGRRARERLRCALMQEPQPHQFNEYAGATHSFANRLPLPRFMGTVFRLRYDQSASDQAWSAVIRFFRQHLATQDAAPKGGG